MKRIMIIGSGGSGKSRLAARLGVILELPVYHLDRLFWHPGWQETPRDEWRAIQERIAAQPRWIVDGNYSGTLEVRLAACDTVIWLDLPTWVCLLGALERYLRYRGRTRPDMGEECTERLNWAYLGWIRSYRRRRRPRVLQALQSLDLSKEAIVLHSRREIDRWLQEIARQAQESATPRTGLR